MFAFAIWDTEAQELFCPRPVRHQAAVPGDRPRRDRLRQREEEPAGAAAALGLSDALDPRALEHYTVLQYVPEPEIAARRHPPAGVGLLRHLRPGGTPRSPATSSPISGAAVRPGSEDARYREIAAALEDSVAKHMRADVTVGSFLSGGIDSTAIAALAMRHNPNLITFTTGFEREGYSEVDVAAETAEAIGARHFVRMVAPRNSRRRFPKSSGTSTIPVADPALVPLYFVAKEARKHVKVVLSGEGADELFGGYTIYREPLSLKPFEYLPGGGAAAARASCRTGFRTARAARACCTAVR